MEQNTFILNYYLQKRHAKYFITCVYYFNSFNLEKKKLCIWWLFPIILNFSLHIVAKKYKCTIFYS